MLPFFSFNWLVSEHNPLLIQTNGLSFFPFAVIFGYLIPTYFFNYFDVSSKILPVHIFLTASILFSVYAVYCTVFKDSGFIPIGTNEYFEVGCLTIRVLYLKFSSLPSLVDAIPG